MLDRSQLYLISPESIELERFAKTLDAVLATKKVAVFQLRLKNSSDDAWLETGARLLPICRLHGVPLIINDRVDLVKKIGADGVHLGVDDGGVEVGVVAAAKKQLGADAIVGISCYDSRDLAMQVADEGADYVSFGAFFPSPTKVSRGKPPLEILKIWSTYTVVPCVAIGGITVDTVSQIANAGADFIAVISCVWQHPKGAVFAVEELSERIFIDLFTV